MSKKNKNKDSCPICSHNLEYNDYVTRRIGLVDENEDLFGWQCPKCDSQFNLVDKITMMATDYGIMEVKANA